MRTQWRRKKHAEGIRKFAVDVVKLEKFVASKL